MKVSKDEASYGLSYSLSERPSDVSWGFGDWWSPYHNPNSGSFLV